MAVQNNPAVKADNNPFKAAPATTFGAGAIQSLITGGTGRSPLDNKGLRGDARGASLTLDG